MTSRNGVIIDG